MQWSIINLKFDQYTRQVSILLVPRRVKFFESSSEMGKPYIIELNLMTHES